MAVRIPFFIPTHIRPPICFLHFLLDELKLPLFLSWSNSEFFKPITPNANHSLRNHHGTSRYAPTHPPAFPAPPNPTPIPTVKDIRHVLRALTQGSPSEQHDAVTRYFTPSASFIHPFCRVPSFSDIPVPFSGGLSLNSRTLILAIYKWYKILSPRIDVEIESTGTCPPSLAPHPSELN